MIKAAIFDLDGVIVDTAKYHYLAWRELAQKLGFEFTLEHNEALKGVSRMASLDILLSVGGLSDYFTLQQKEAMAAEKNSRYLEYVNKMTSEEVFSGVVSFINSLRERNIGVALGSASKNSAIILSCLGIEYLFDAIIDGNMVSTAKPDPQVFLLAAEMLGVDSTECVVFEDAEAGVEVAHRAGMYCVGVGGSPLLCKAEIQINDFNNISIKSLFKNIRHNDL